ncbi:MAG: leucyl aminopeptidase, partial [Cyanobacteria bacterium]|nr:leucyl aminopeptidase [Cyanobacteriota bacterium]
MKYELAKLQSLQSYQCLAAGFFSNGDRKDLHPLLGQSFQEITPSLLEKMHEPGDWTWQNDLQGRSIMLIHCGKREEFTSAQLLKRLTDINGVLLKQGIATAAISLPQIINEDPDWQITQMLLQLDGLNYCLDKYKSQPKKRTLDSVAFFLHGASLEALDAAIAISAGMQLTKNLSNLPANHCTPTYLGTEAEKLAKEYSQISAKVHDVKAIKNVQMGAFLAV